jgi:16S rRNA (guanine966-N2)-methyltransferase
MKIASGRFKGKTLIVPKTGVKPTSEMVRQAVINITRPILNGARVLDLYCGTGAVGIETLSNGASFCCFIENSSKVYNLLKQNLANIVVDRETYKTIKHNARELNTEIFGDTDFRFDIIFADPFYKDTKYNFEHVHNFALEVLNDNSFFIIEHGSNLDFSSYEGFSRLHKYGDTCLSVFIKEARDG